MKKSLSVTTLGLAVLGFGFTNNASASEIDTVDKQPVLVDFDTIQSTKTSSVPSLTIAAAPKNDSNISVYTPFLVTHMQLLNRNQLRPKTMFMQKQELSMAMAH